LSDSATGVLGAVSSLTPGANASGVWGANRGTGSNGNGVLGSHAGGGIGVFGASAGGRGVFGYATASSGVNYGVYGKTNSPDDGFAGFFEGKVKVDGKLWVDGEVEIDDDVDVDGDLHVSGTLSKGAGSFKIDHPLDPANKYLSHSFVESPDMMNIYNGIAKLDAEGEAWVDLPEWLEALNRDFRYQLTPIGAPGPNLYIDEEVASGRFKIAGGAPGMKVSWQLTGIRRDAYAERYRIPVEQDKPAPERGYYLHPEAFGQSLNRSTGAAHRPQPHGAGFSTSGQN
jgi:hypothetical protein